MVNTLLFTTKIYLYTRVGWLGDCLVNGREGAKKLLI